MTNQDITGLTLAAIAFDALENGSETDNGLPDAVRNAAFAENFYGVAAIGSYDPATLSALVSPNRS